MTDAESDPREKLLDAALNHVPFDGWSDATFRAAIADSEIEPALAKSLFPRGAVDLALAYHARGDAAMLAKIESADMEAMRFRDRIAAAVRFRLEVADRELVRRGTTLFALPQHAADGTKAIWGTADAIWTALGDTSEDANWYTKRATLSAVYSATALYWLGDDSEGNRATWEFLDRRIENVMTIEKIKADVNRNPLLKPLMMGPNWVMSQIKAPGKHRMQGFPGSTTPRG